MNAQTFNRLHGLRLENDAAGFALDELRPRFERLAGRHENGTAPRAVSAFQLFQTPPDLAARLVAALELQPGQTVLEPSAGLGRILDALPKGCNVVAVEMAANIAGELFQQNRPDVKLIQRDFLTCSPDDPAFNSGPGASRFDAVAMNPPFHLRADVRHILHARQFLKPGGRLAALCFDTPHRAKALRHLCATWEHIPAGTFGKEGTSVPTVLLTMEASA
jgi:SAM-dependent methyltransferase